MERVIFGGILALGLTILPSAQAGVSPECSMAKWTGGTTVPSDAVGSPQSAPVVARYSEYCGLAVSAAGYVQSPATSDTRYFGRFYVHLDATGGTEVILFEAYDGSDNPVFTVSYDGANLIFDAAAGGEGSAPAVAGEWNLVEFEFNSGGNANVWVNQSWDFVGAAYDSTTIAPFSSGTGTIAYVRLGVPVSMGGFTGTFTFDAFEAHRTTNVGALIDCDADASGNPDINLNDILAVINERFGNPSVLANGQPDCNRDGEINLNDILDTIAVAFPP